jgi:hypothetical protein
MGCKIAENLPLSKLATTLGVPLRCHGRRHACIQNLSMEAGDVVLGASGAVLGYCQALFQPSTTPTEHTIKVKRLLSEIDAPWAQSHELFLGHRGSRTTMNFVSGAFEPLRGTGRVPILITGLDPADDAVELEKIVASSIPVPESQTVLVRVVLKSPDSIDAAAKMLLRMVDGARSNRRLPLWWPLLQSALPVSEWQRLRSLLGDVWHYTNIAVNPFADDALFDEASEQITVGQIAVGKTEGIYDDGRISVAPEMKILGSEAIGSYSLYDFLERLAKLRVVPTLIVLGPSQLGWNDEENQNRLVRLLPLLRRGCDTLWHGLTPERRNEVWKLAA